MRQTIHQLAARARALEPDAPTRQAWFEQVAGFADQFLDANATAPAFRLDDGTPAGFPLAEAGAGLGPALDLFQTDVLDTGINPTSGRFLGYIPGGGLYASALGDFLAAVTNRYAGAFFAAPGAVRLENQLLRWMADEVGFPTSAGGHLASGGSLANLTAIVTARDAAGLAGPAIPRAVIYVTAHTHHCIDKALHIAGLGAVRQRVVATDQAYRLDPAALEAAILADRRAGLSPWLVVGSAGTTDTGAIDPLPAIAELALAHRIWFHADGAYGGFFVLCPEGQAALAGMERADSLVMDPHKTLFLPYGTGALLVRDQAYLLAAHSGDAAYLQDFPDQADEVSPADLSPELTRHFRGLRLWLPLHLAGVDAFRAALAEKLYLARYFHEQLARQPGFEMGAYPDLSVVTFRYRPPRGDADDFNRRLTALIQADGRIFLSSTRLRGHFVLRAAIVCFRTHLEEIELALATIPQLARRLAEQV